LLALKWPILRQAVACWLKRAGAARWHSSRVALLLPFPLLLLLLLQLMIKKAAVLMTHRRAIFKWAVRPRLDAKAGVGSRRAHRSQRRAVASALARGFPAGGIGGGSMRTRALQSPSRPPPAARHALPPLGHVAGRDLELLPGERRTNQVATKVLQSRDLLAQLLEDR
jgi:hypothetical protein